MVQPKEHVLTRRSFVAAAGALGALAAAPVARASAAGSLSSLFGVTDEDGAADAAGEAPVAPAAGEPGPFASLSDDEVASVLLSSLMSFDFQTVLDLCATDEFAAAGGWVLSSIAQVSDLAFVDIPIDWDHFPLPVEGTLLTLMGARLRGLYAADIMRGLAKAAADLAGIDVYGMDLEDRTGNVCRQLSELDTALAAFDASSFEVIRVEKCTQVADAVEMGWLRPEYALFEAGRERASLIGTTSADLATSVYRCLVGQGGQPLIAIMLPLCRYESGWKLQRPCVYETTDSSFFSYNSGETDSSSDAALSVGEVVLPHVDFAPADRREDEPFASIGDASDAVLAALGFDVSGFSPEIAARAGQWRSASGFGSLFCADAYLAGVDPATLYEVDDAFLANQLDFPRMGTISSFFLTSVAYLPVREQRFRVLSAAMYASKFAALPLINEMATYVKRQLIHGGAYSPTYTDFLDAFSPMPIYVNPMSVDLSIGAVLYGSDVNKEELPELIAVFKADFPFKMVADYLRGLQEYWARFGDPTIALVADDESTDEQMDAIEGFFGGESKVSHTACYSQSGVWRIIRSAISRCGEGYRVADIEYLSQLGGLMPFDAQWGVSTFEGVTPEEAAYALESGELGDGLVEDVRFLAG